MLENNQNIYLYTNTPYRYVNIYIIKVLLYLIFTNVRQHKKLVKKSFKKLSQLFNQKH